MTSLPTGESPATCKNLRNVGDTGAGGGGRCCQQNTRLELGQKGSGSALWIRTVVDTIGMERRGEFQNVTVFLNGIPSRNLRQDLLEGLRSRLVCLKGLELPYQLPGASGARSSRWTHQLGVRVTLMRTVVDSRLPIGHKLPASDLSR